MVEVLLRKLNNAKAWSKETLCTIKAGALYAWTKSKPVIKSAGEIVRDTAIEAKDESIIGWIRLKKWSKEAYAQAVEMMKGSQALLRATLALLISITVIDAVNILSKINVTVPHTIDEKIMTNPQAAHDAAEKVLTNYADREGLKVTIEGQGISGTVISQTYSEKGAMGTLLCNDKDVLKVTSKTTVKEFNDITGRRGLQEEDHAMRLIREELLGEPTDDKQKQLQSIIGDNVRILWAMKCQGTVEGQVDYWSVVQGESRYTIIVRFIEGKKADIIAYIVTDDVEV